MLRSLTGGGGGASSGSGMLGRGASEESPCHGSCGVIGGGTSGPGSGIGVFRERMRSATSDSSMGRYMGLIFVIPVDAGGSRARSDDLALSSTMAWRTMKTDSTRRW